MIPQKTLVTGAAGFIGFHVARRSLERGDEVVGLDNINDYYDVRLKYARLAETGIEEGQIQYAESNLVGYVNLIEASRPHEIKHLVYTSSSRVYGANPVIIIRTSPTGSSVPRGESVSGRA